MSHGDLIGLHLDTLAITAGYDPASAFGAAKPPVFLTSTYVYESAQHAKEVHRAFFAGESAAGSSFIYTRLGHPNLDMVEQRLAALDAAEESAVFCTGMAAHTAVAFASLRSGDTLVHTRPIYSGVDGLMYGQLDRFGVRAFPIVDALDEAAVRAALEAAAAVGPVGLVIVETPANPTAAVADIALIARLAHELGARQGRRPVVVVDNTFLGPLLQSPLTQGADLTLTSLTKYCAGHSDMMGGGVSGRRELIEPLKKLRMVFGTHLDPFSSWLLLRSLETLPLRTARACSNAVLVASFLRDHAKVPAVTFLGFTTQASPALAVLQRQARGTGSTFSFRIRGGETQAFALLDRLKLLRMAVSLGGSETLICHPATTTHYAVPPERRSGVGIDDSTLRISVGLEHPDDLIADLAQALEAV